MCSGILPGATLTLDLTPPVADAFVSYANPTSNFGGSGAMQIAGSGVINGQFDCVLNFNTAASKAAFDAQFGAGNWSVTGTSLRLTAASGGQSLFTPQNSGDVNVTWLQNPTWVEGTGSPVAPTTTGITAATLPSFLGTGDQALGTIHFNAATNGTAGTSTTYPLTPSSGLATTVGAGGIVGLDLVPADTTVSYLIYSRSYSTTNFRPALTLVATTAASPSGDTNVTVGILQTSDLTNGANTTVSVGAQLITGNAGPGAISQTNFTVNGNARTDGNATFAAAFAPATAGTVTLAGNSATALNIGIAGSAKLGNVVFTAANGGATLADGGQLIAGNCDNASGGSLTVGKNATATLARLQIAGTLSLQGASGQTAGLTTISASSPTAPTPIGDPIRVSRIGTLTIANDGAVLGTRSYYASLDLKNNDLIVLSGGTSLADVSDMIRAGIGSTPNAPTWNGIGLKTSAAIVGTGLGAINNFANPVNNSGGALYSQFDGQDTSAGGQVLVKYTWYGDLNVDGTVTSLDFALLDAGSAGTVQANGRAGWYFGDVTYDGVVDSNDVSLIQTGWTAYSAGSTSLPEPNSWGLAVLGFVVLFASRRFGR